MNARAVDAQLGWAVDRTGASTGTNREEDGKVDGFEEAFNLSCRYLALEDLNAAEKMQGRAEGNSSPSQPY